MLQTLDARDTWTLTLYEAAHNNPSNKTSHTRMLYRPRCGMWQRRQNHIFHPGCFSTQKACCGFLIESRSAPLIIRLLTGATCPFPWWKCSTTRVNSRNRPLVADWSTIAGSLKRVKKRAQAWMSKLLKTSNVNSSAEMSERFYPNVPLPHMIRGENLSRTARPPAPIDNTQQFKPHLHTSNHPLGPPPPSLPS